jgi:hypothetical protein
MRDRVLDRPKLMALAGMTVLVLIALRMFTLGSVSLRSDFPAFMPSACRRFRKRSGLTIFHRCYPRCLDYVKMQQRVAPCRAKTSFQRFLVPTITDRCSH